jgi:hypothetical protein
VHYAHRIGDEPLVDYHRDPVAAEALQVRAELHRVVAERDELRIAPDASAIDRCSAWC